jgi:peroxiredoxin
MTEIDKKAREHAEKYGVPLPDAKRRFIREHFIEEVQGIKHTTDTQLGMSQLITIVEGVLVHLL